MYNVYIMQILDPNMRAQHHWIITGALKKMAVRWWLIMIGELFPLAWILETTLAEGGRVNRGEGIWDIISLQQIRKFHVEEEVARIIDLHLAVIQGVRPHQMVDRV